MPTQCSPYLDTCCDACDASCSCLAGPGSDDRCPLHGALSTHAAPAPPEREGSDGAALTR